MLREALRQLGIAALIVTAAAIQAPLRSSSSPITGGMRKGEAA